MSYSLEQSSVDGSFHIIENKSGNNVLVAHSDTKMVSAKVGSITRTMTSATNQFALPANAVPISLKVLGSTESNAGTTATISIGITGTNTYFLSGQDVKAVNGQFTCTTATNLGVTVGSSAVEVVGLYAETGTASSQGGPWVFVIEYYLP